MFIEILDKKREAEYTDFLCKGKHALFTASNKYRLLLKKLLGAEDVYFLAIDDDDHICGALPSFLKCNDCLENILNSLPFFGSVGSIIEYEKNHQTRKLLLEAFNKFAFENNCVSSTVITSPFEENTAFYEEWADFTCRDERIGQITFLPHKTTSVEDRLMDKFDSIGRRNIRKALKSGVIVSDEPKAEFLQFLVSTHIENIQSIGGIFKPKAFFELIPEFFAYGTDYKIFTASIASKTVAALLVFYFNKMVEYYTPAIIKEYRPFQPMSLLIFEAMNDAAKRGFELWNWGGTWLSQKGVYQFKKKWGAKDMPYFYYTKVYDKKITTLTKEELLLQYPYCYVIPFSKLNKHEN